MHSLLVIGCGSIGERHLRCFQQTRRCLVTACDTREVLLSGVTKRYGVPGYASLDEALAGSTFDAAVICTPAPMHLPMAIRLLESGLSVLVEKPLAVDDDLVPQVRVALAKSRRFLAVAYVYHVMPWISQARDCLLAGEIGRALHVSVTAGQHFPTFRPAYREIYYARHDQGGGTVQDALTHLVNAVEWMVGSSTHVFCDAAHQVLEGVGVEDTVNASARHGEVLASYAMNQFQAPNETTIAMHGESGSLKIEVHRQRWGKCLRGNQDWTWHETAPLHRDELFTSQAQAFLDGLEGRRTHLCSFEEAVQTLKFNQAALRSIHSGMPVMIS